MKDAFPGEPISRNGRESIFRALGDSWDAPPAAPLPAPPPPKNLIRQFVRAATANAATAEVLPGEDAIPHAAARVLRAMRAPPNILCPPEWRGLDWDGAGIFAECRAPKDEDAAGLTGVVAAAADCGAMLVRGGAPFQLSASLLPRIHIAAVAAKNIAPTLNDVFAMHRPPGAAALICGPSRTADIEQTLVMGMHGPLSVHVLVVKQPRG